MARKFAGAGQRRFSSWRPARCRCVGHHRVVEASGGSAAFEGTTPDWFSGGDVVEALRQVKGW
jgi:hypothetical protein